jgi:hypothetical protein
VAVGGTGVVTCATGVTVAADSADVPRLVTLEMPHATISTPLASSSVVRTSPHRATFPIGRSHFHQVRSKFSLELPLPASYVGDHVVRSACFIESNIDGQRFSRAQYTHTAR